MSNIPFISLDTLEKKPSIDKWTGLVVQYSNVRDEKKEIPGLDEEETEKGEQIEPENVDFSIKIKDNRKTSNLSRTAVLDKLKVNMLVSHIDDSKTIRQAPAPVVIQPVGPTKIAKRLVIKQKAVQTFEPLPKPIDLLEEKEKAAEPKTGEQQLEANLEKGEPQKDEPELEELMSNIGDLDQVEPVVMKEIVAPKKKRGKPGPFPEDLKPVDLTTAVIRTQKVIDRLPKEREHVIIKAPTYYMNNRKIFIQKLTELLNPYKKDLLEAEQSVSCDSRSQGNDFDLLTHQKIVRDYLNLYTPYRGLLLYHGLGSGKTCTSIAIAEGMKSNKRVFVLTPAALKSNFFKEMKKCGDHLYKKNQYWEFVTIDGNPEYVGILSRALSLSTEYIRNKGGAWLVNINKEPNFSTLLDEQQVEVDEQLNEMIRSKYTDINYNGLTMKHLRLMTDDFSKNPFDNAVVVVDEAHNFVSRIVNKIKKPKTIPYMLYDYLMNATNVKIVLLTGTPIINYPNEIGILYNILRGYIKTWTIPISWEKTEKLNTDTILQMFDDANFKTYDYVDYADNKLNITRNPFGFINAKKRGRISSSTQKTFRGGAKRKTKRNQKPKGLAYMIAEKLSFEPDEIDADEDVAMLDRQDQNLYKGGGEVFDRYNGVHLDETGNFDDNTFIHLVANILKNKKNNVTVRDAGIVLTKSKALPDDSAAFISMFIDADTGNAKNINLFKRRILGLTSYFRSAQEQLLPNYVKTEEGDIYHVVKTEMTLHQFGIYEKIRKEEADREKSAKKQKRKQSNSTEELFTLASTYRIFSRAACNFTFPPEIDRPIPNIKLDTNVNEVVFDAVPADQVQQVNIYSSENEDANDGETQKAEEDEEEDEKLTNADSLKYTNRIEKALIDLNVKIEGTNDYKYLSKSALPEYSPKFAKILENLTDPANEGLHLIYSHFRTIEGVGIMRMILLANGFAEFKLQKNDSIWELVETEEDAGKPKFALHTGTETAEEKDIILNVYNGLWDLVPASITVRLREIAENNLYGEVIKALMITSSGAEGIDLKNTRFVHITEPYWHMVRVEQVVGRARRTCSHQDLPEELRTVKVFLYVSTFNEQQKKDERNIELRIRDVSKIDKKTPITTDESLYEIASIKQRINNQVLLAVKESAIDCNLHANKKSTGKDDGEQLICYGFGKVESNQFSSYPSLEKDQSEKEGLDVKRVAWKATKITLNNVDYALNESTKEVYDFESYQRAMRLGTELILFGTLVNEGGKMRLKRV